MSGMSVDEKKEIELSVVLINLLNEHCQHGHAKTIDGKLYHCIAGSELLSIAKSLLEMHEKGVQ